MWSVLSGDFDQANQPDAVVRNVLDKSHPGCIILMHDTLKAKSNLLSSLPLIIQGLKTAGFSFGRL